MALSMDNTCSDSSTFKLPIGDLEYPSYCHHRRGGTHCVTKPFSGAMWPPLFEVKEKYKMKPPAFPPPKQASYTHVEHKASLSSIGQELINPSLPLPGTSITTRSDLSYRRALMSVPSSGRPKEVLERKKRIQNRTTSKNTTVTISGSETTLRNKDGVVHKKELFVTSDSKQISPLHSRPYEWKKVFRQTNKIPVNYGSFFKDNPTASKKSSGDAFDTKSQSTNSNRSRCGLVTSQFTDDGQWTLVTSKRRTVTANGPFFCPSRSTNNSLETSSEDCLAIDSDEEEQEDNGLGESESMLSNGNIEEPCPLLLILNKQPNDREESQVKNMRNNQDVKDEGEETSTRNAICNIDHPINADLTPEDSTELTRREAAIRLLKMYSQRYWLGNGQPAFKHHRVYFDGQLGGVLSDEYESRGQLHELQSSQFTDPSEGCVDGHQEGDYQPSDYHINFQFSNKDHLDHLTCQVELNDETHSPDESVSTTTSMHCGDIPSSAARTNHIKTPGALWDTTAARDHKLVASHFKLDCLCTLSSRGRLGRTPYPTFSCKTIFLNTPFAGRKTSKFVFPVTTGRQLLPRPTLRGSDVALTCVKHPPKGLRSPYAVDTPRTRLTQEFKVQERRYMLLLGPLS